MNTELIEKIEKLLKKSEGTDNQHEAQVFLNKAQELMAKNKISMMDIKTLNETKEEKVDTDTILEERSSSSRNVRLANIVAKNYFCTVYKRGNSLVFMGMESDLKIATLAFSSIHTFMEKKRSQVYRQAQKAGQQTKGIREDYVLGFLQGLEEGFKKNVESLGLMIIVPEAVTTQLDKICGGRTSNARQTKSTGNRETYMKGYEDGKGFNKQIN